MTKDLKKVTKVEMMNHKKMNDEKKVEMFNEMGEADKMLEAEVVDEFIEKVNKSVEAIEAKNIEVYLSLTILVKKELEESENDPTDFFTGKPLPKFGMAANTLFKGEFYFMDLVLLESLARAIEERYKLEGLAKSIREYRGAEEETPTKKKQ